MPKRAKRINLKGPGKCIFCDRIAGTIDDDVTVSLSKQHLWPEWLAKEPSQERHDQHFGSQVRINALPGNTIAIKPDMQVRQGDVKSRKLRIVCEYHCNNGWISRLEDGTRDFLPPLIRGDFFSLTESQQREFALWLAVMCTVWEYTDVPTQAISIGDRKHIHNAREAPPTWSIWIGNYRGSDWKTRYRHQSAHVLARPSSGKIDVIGPNPPNTQTSSFVLGELFMYVSSSNVPNFWRTDQETEIRGMSRIWPIKGGDIQCPNLLTLNDAAVGTIADRLFSIGLQSLKGINW